MMKMNKNKKGQAGFVITVELLLIVTVLVFGLVAGWSKLRDQTIAELSDTGSAVGAIDQSYVVAGTNWIATTSGIAAHQGFQFDDTMDVATSATVGGDGATIAYNAPAGTTTGGTFENSTF